MLISFLLFNSSLLYKSAISHFLICIYSFHNGHRHVASGAGAHLLAEWCGDGIGRRNGISGVGAERESSSCDRTQCEGMGVCCVSSCMWCGDGDAFVCACARNGLVGLRVTVRTVKVCEFEFSCMCRSPPRIRVCVYFMCLLVCVVVFTFYLMLISFNKYIDTCGIRCAQPRAHPCFVCVLCVVVFTNDFFAFEHI